MVLDPGKMYRPTAVAFDIGNNTVYVVEQFNHRISKWDYTAGVFDFTLNPTWGSNGDGTSGEGGPIGDGGSTDNSLYRPSDIVFDLTNGLLYVTDTFHNRVRVLTASTGAFTTSLGVGGSAADEFYRPFGIAIDVGTDDTVVIADELNQRVVKYDVSGGTLDSPVVLVDPSVTTGLSFIRPHGVVYDVTAAEFNIGDSLRSIISSYNVAGVFQNQYGTPGSTANNVNLFYPSSGQGLLAGTTTTIFADTRNNAIKLMEDETITLTTGTTDGTGDGELYWPESASSFVDGANYVLAANTYNNRVEAYSNVATALTFEENFGSP